MANKTGTDVHDDQIRAAYLKALEAYTAAMNLWIANNGGAQALAGNETTPPNPPTTPPGQ